MYGETVRGTIVGGEHRPYAFFDLEGNCLSGKRVLYFPTDEAAIDYAAETWPDAYRRGIEVRCWDQD